MKYIISNTQHLDYLCLFNSFFNSSDIKSYRIKHSKFMLDDIYNFFFRWRTGVALLYLMILLNNTVDCNLTACHSMLSRAILHWYVINLKIRFKLSPCTTFSTRSCCPLNLFRSSCSNTWLTLLAFLEQLKEPMNDAAIFWLFDNRPWTGISSLATMAGNYFNHHPGQTAQT